MACNECNNDMIIVHPCNECEHIEQPCQQEECGCTHFSSTACIIYQGKNIASVDIYDGMSLDEIVRAIGNSIQIIQERKDDIRLKSLGNGARVYKEFDGYSFSFRSIADSNSVSVKQTEKDIALSVRESYIIDLIKSQEEYYNSLIKNLTNNIVNSAGFSSNNRIIELRIPDSLTKEGFINSTPNALTVTADDIYVFTHKKKIYLFKKGKGVYGSNNPLTAEDFVEIGGGDPTVIESSKVGYKLIETVGENKFKAKTIATKSLDIKEKDGTLYIDYIPDKDGVRAFYVNEKYTGESSDGSVVRPYKTWGEAKKALIGNGTTYKPDTRYVKVVFQSDITTNEKIDLPNITYQFDDITFTYTGAGAILDTTEIKNAFKAEVNARTYPYKSITDSAWLVIDGKVSFRKTDYDSPLMIKTGGIFTKDFYDARSQWFLGNPLRHMIQIIVHGDVNIKQPEPNEAQINRDFIKSFKSRTSSEAWKNDSQQDIFVTKRKASQPLIQIEGTNAPLRGELFIFGGNLSVKTINAPIIEAKEGSVNIQGESLMVLKQHERYLPYGEIKDVGDVRYYTPHPTLNWVELTDGDIGTPFNGQKIDAKAWGAINPNVGGINAYFKFNVNHNDRHFPTGFITTTLYAGQSRANHFIDVSYADGAGPAKAIIGEIDYTSSTEGDFIKTNKEVQGEELYLRVYSGSINSKFHKNIINKTSSTAVSELFKLEGVEVNGFKTSNNFPKLTTEEANNLTDMLPGAYYVDYNGFLKIKQ